jgi:thiol:disulfide interchange protein
LDEHRIESLEPGFDQTLRSSASSAVRIFTEEAAKASRHSDSVDFLLLVLNKRRGMELTRSLPFFVCVLFLVASFDARAGGTTRPGKTRYVPVTRYDPKRDAVKDIQGALAEARRTGKRVLLEVGGDWCVWCHRMDRYVEENPKLLELRERKFITVKLNYSPENENKKVLSAYPEIPGYPHIFVLDTNGVLLHSQDTGELESGKSYDLERFIAFLKKWARS